MMWCLLLYIVLVSVCKTRGELYNTTEASRDELLQRAKLAQQAERYDDMAGTMKRIAELGNALTDAENNLLYEAYKNVASSRRSELRIFSSIEEKSEDIKAEDIKTEYKERIEQELKNICAEILGLLDDNLIPSAHSAAAKVLYLKMKGDFYWYLAEVVTDERDNDLVYAGDSYSCALHIAKSQMPPTHPTRLALALNFSVFYYEILNERDTACYLAKEAFDDAIAELDTLNKEMSKETTQIMQVLRDQLTLWTSEQENDKPEPEQGNN